MDDQQKVALGFYERILVLTNELAEAREIADAWGQVFEVDAEGNQIMVDPEDAWNDYGDDDEVLWDTICPSYGELKRFWAARDRWRARSWA